MKVLIAGASGFLGGYLVDDLQQDEVSLTLLDRDQPSLWVDGCTFIQKEISECEDFEDALFDVDAVVYLANLAHSSGNEELDFYMKANCFSTLNFATQCIRAGVRKFIYFSSENVFKLEGESEHSSLADFQTLSKYQAEKSLKDLQLREPSMKILVVRPSLIYGVGVKANIASLLTLIRRHIPLPFSCLSNRKNYIYAGNVASFVSMALSIEWSFDFHTESISDCRLTLCEFAQLVARSGDMKSIIFCVPRFLLRVGFYVIRKESLYKSIIEVGPLPKSCTGDFLGWTPPTDYKKAFFQSFKVEK